MKPRGWIFALLALVALGAGAGWLVQQQRLAATGADGAPDPEQGRRADRFLDLLDQSRWDEALAMTTPALQDALGQGRLEQIWSALPAQLGPRRSRGTARAGEAQGQPIVRVPFEFGLMPIDAWLSFDAQQRIQGFRLVPGRAVAPATREFVRNEILQERAVLVGSDERALPGTLTLPRSAGPHPAVVLVHGSGPQDRDAALGPNRPLRDLAHGLARHGIASLRYDKRSLVRPQDFAAGRYTVDDEVVDDALAAIETLSAAEGIDRRRVFVVAHSLGAMLAPRIVQRAPQLAGAVLMAPAGRPLPQVYLDQVEYVSMLDGNLDPEEGRRLEAERLRADAVATLAPGDSAEHTLLGLPAAYWVDLRDYDPVQLARALPQPLLVLQGGRDYQIRPERDFARWQQAFAGDVRVSLRQFPTLDHLFIAGEGPSHPAAYTRPGSVDPAVIDEIARWIGEVR